MKIYLHSCHMFIMHKKTSFMVLANPQNNPVMCHGYSCGFKYKEVNILKQIAEVERA